MRLVNELMVSDIRASHTPRADTRGGFELDSTNLQVGLLQNLAVKHQMCLFQTI